jgi:hypothetical protein
MQVERVKFVAPAWMAAIFAAVLLPLFATPVLPIIDLYDHLARFFILSRIGTDRMFQMYYQAHWALLPNIGVDIIGTPLMKILPVASTGHVLIAIILAVLYGGVLAFHRVRTGEWSLLTAVLLAPLLYSYVLNWGFINFLLGLGLAFWTASFWIANRDRPKIAVPVACLCAAAIYLAHGVAFALYWLLIAALETGYAIEQRPLRIGPAFRNFAAIAAQAIVPIALFAAWHAKEVAAKPIPTAADPLVAHQAHNGLYRLSTILRVEEGPAYWFDLATLTLQLAAIALLLSKRSASIPRNSWPPVALGLILMIAVPSKLFGAFYISDRMPLFAALCALGCLSFVGFGRHAADRLAGTVIVSVAAVRLAVTAVAWHGYGAQYREFQSLEPKIAQGSLVSEVMIGAGHHETKVPRCEMFGPMLVLDDRAAAPLFSDPNQQPLVKTGRLKTAAESLQGAVPVPRPETVDYRPYMAGAIKAGFDYLLVCNANLLSQPLPAGLEVIGKTAHFQLLRATEGHGSKILKRLAT